MILGTTYRLQINTSVHLKELDDEACQALVSIMHHVSILYGVQILTYRIRWANIMMLVESRLDHFSIRDFLAADEGDLGSGKTMLFDHFSKYFGDNAVDLLNHEISDIAESLGVSADIATHRVARRIGNTEEFQVHVSRDFSKWVERNRPQLFSELDGQIIGDVAQGLMVEGDYSLRNTASEMDHAAVDLVLGHDTPAVCSGYADALRGNQHAITGLKILTACPDIASVEKLEYGAWLHMDRSELLSELETEVGKIEDTSLSNCNGQHLVKRKRRSSRRASVDRVKKQVRVTSEIPFGLKSVISGFMLLLIIIGGMGYFALNSATQKNASPEPLEANELVLVDDAKSYESDDLSIQLGELASPEAYELAKKFAMSSDPNERLKMSRNPEQTKKHLPDYPAQAIDVPAERIDRGKILRSSDIVFRAFPAIFSDGSRRVICVLITDDGLRVDWDSYAFYGTATWPELLSGERKTADIRALASQRSYYNFNYRDENQWLCIELVTPDYDRSLYAYAHRTSQTGKMLIGWLKDAPAKARRPLTLRISSTAEDSKRRQFTIERLLALSPVVGDVDAEDTINLDDL